MSITSSNDGYQAERRQTSLVIAGVQFAKKGSKLQRHGALPLGNSGYFLPNTEENRERFEWLATAVRTEGGEASVLEVQAIDNCSFEQMKQQFSNARAEDYRKLLKEL